MDLFENINYVLNYPNVSIKIENLSIADRNSVNNYIIFRFLSFHKNIDVKNTIFLLNRYTFNFYKNRLMLFRLACAMTPVITGNSAIRYVKKPKGDDNIKYDKRLIDIFKEIHGKFNNTKAIIEIIDYTKENLKDEFLKICIDSGLTLVEILKMFPELKDSIDSSKIKKTDQNQYIKLIKKINKFENANNVLTGDDDDVKIAGVDQKDIDLKAKKIKKEKAPKKEKVVKTVSKNVVEITQEIENLI